MSNVHTFFVVDTAENANVPKDGLREMGVINYIYAKDV